MAAREELLALLIKHDERARADWCARRQRNDGDGEPVGEPEPVNEPVVEPEPVGEPEPVVVADVAIAG